MEQFHLTSNATGKAFKCNFGKFTDLVEFAAYADHDSGHFKYDDLKFKGETVKQARANCAGGSTAHAARSDALIAAMESDLDFSSQKQATVMAVAGGCPNVPALLAGQPLSMYRRQRIQTATAPITVVVDLTVSAGVNVETIDRRGAATLALVRNLASKRAVNLWVMAACKCDYDDSKAGGFMVRLDTSPMDLARLAWVMQSAGFFRYYGFAAISLQGLQRKSTSEGGLQWLGPLDDHAKRLADYAAQMIGTDSRILQIAGLYSDKSEQPFRSDANAVDWIKAQLATVQDD